MDKGGAKAERGYPGPKGVATPNGTVRMLKTYDRLRFNHLQLQHLSISGAHRNDK